MAYSYFDYEGTDTTIQTNILCVSTEHMYAFKVLSEEKSKVTLSDVALAATFTKNDAGVLCELNTAPSTKIRVIRSTPYDVLMHDFSNGAQFNAFSVDEVYEQVLYLCQELVEGKLIIDSSGNFGGTRAGISPKELQAQLAAQYSMGYSVGSAHQGKVLEEKINKVADELAKKADKATTLAGYGLGNAIAVLTGTIADGGTIPLPAGFTEEQCKWFVSMASDNPSLRPWSIDETVGKVHYRFECTASAARVVNAKMYWQGQGGSRSGSVPSTANYLVIAYK